MKPSVKRLAVVAAIGCATVAVNGCGLLGSAGAPDDLKAAAISAANSICGEANWSTEDRSSESAETGNSYTVVMTCSKNPQIAFDEYPARLAQALNFPIENIAVHAGEEPPALARVDGGQEHVRNGWAYATLSDLGSDPGASDGKPGEGPQLIVTSSEVWSAIPSPSTSEQPPGQ